MDELNDPGDWIRMLGENLDLDHLMSIPEDGHQYVDLDDEPIHDQSLHGFCQGPVNNISHFDQTLWAGYNPETEIASHLPNAHTRVFQTPSQLIGLRSTDPLSEDQNRQQEISMHSFVSSSLNSDNSNQQWDSMASLNSFSNDSEIQLQSSLSLPDPPEVHVNKKRSRIPRSKNHKSSKHCSASGAAYPKALPEGKHQPGLSTPNVESNPDNNPTKVKLSPRAALALLEESFTSFSKFSQRKAADLVQELEKLILDEEKYGNFPIDLALDPVATDISSSDSQHSSSRSDIADSETDGTSVVSDSLPDIKPEREETSSAAGIEPKVSEDQYTTKPLHFCTKNGCSYSTHSFTDWKRHEEGEKHWPQERFMCLECPSVPLPVDVDGNLLCEYCLSPFLDMTVSNHDHYLNCQAAKQDGTTFGRKDHLIQHLRDVHGMPNMSHMASLWKYGVDSRWPRECGFCGDQFDDWSHRMSHISQHYLTGARKSAWKLPFPKPKHKEPSAFDTLPKDDDDDDDDDDDQFGNGKGGSRKRVQPKQNGKKTDSQNKRRRQTNSKQINGAYQSRGEGAFFDDLNTKLHSSLSEPQRPLSLAVERYLEDRQDVVTSKLLQNQASATPFTGDSLQLPSDKAHVENHDVWEIDSAEFDPASECGSSGYENNAFQRSIVNISRLWTKTWEYIHWKSASPQDHPCTPEVTGWYSRQPDETYIYKIGSISQELHFSSRHMKESQRVIDFVKLSTLIFVALITLFGCGLYLLPNATLLIAGPTSVLIAYSFIGLISIFVFEAIGEMVTINHLDHAFSQDFTIFDQPSIFVQRGFYSALSTATICWLSVTSYRKLESYDLEDPRLSSPVSSTTSLAHILFGMVLCASVFAIYIIKSYASASQARVRTHSFKHVERAILTGFCLLSLTILKMLSIDHFMATFALFLLLVVWPAFCLDNRIDNLGRKPPLQDARDNCRKEDVWTRIWRTQLSYGCRIGIPMILLLGGYIFWFFEVRAMMNVSNASTHIFEIGLLGTAFATAANSSHLSSYYISSIGLHVGGGNVSRNGHLTWNTSTTMSFFSERLQDTDWTPSYTTYSPTGKYYRQHNALPLSVPLDFTNSSMPKSSLKRQLESVHAFMNPDYSRFALHQKRLPHEHHSDIDLEVGESFNISELIFPESIFGSLAYSAPNAPAISELTPKFENLDFLMSDKNNRKDTGRSSMKRFWYRSDFEPMDADILALARISLSSDSDVFLKKLTLISQESGKEALSELEGTWLWAKQSLSLSDGTRAKSAITPLFNLSALPRCVHFAMAGSTSPPGNISSTYFRWPVLKGHSTEYLDQLGHSWNRQRYLELAFFDYIDHRPTKETLEALTPVTFHTLLTFTGLELEEPLMAMLGTYFVKLRSLIFEMFSSPDVIAYFFITVSLGSIVFVGFDFGLQLISSLFSISLPNLGFESVFSDNSEGLDRSTAA